MIKQHTYFPFDNASTSKTRPRRYLSLSLSLFSLSLHQSIMSAPAPHKRFRKNNHQSSNLSTRIRLLADARAGLPTERLQPEAASNAYGSNHPTYIATMRQHIMASCAPQREHLSDGTLVDDPTRIQTVTRQLIGAITATTFCEYTVCDSPVDPSMPHVHGRIVASQTIPDIKYHDWCKVCPMDGIAHDVTQVVLKGPAPVTLQEIQRYQADWRNLHRQLMSANRMLDGALQCQGLVTNHRKHQATGAELQRKEWNAWEQYKLVAFDHVRYAVCCMYNVIIDNVGINVEGRFPSLPAYEQFLKDVEVDMQKRTRMPNLPRMWCFKHNCAGYLFPTAGRKGHNPACWVCRVDNMEDPDQQQQQNRQYVSSEEYQRYTKPSIES